MTVYELLRRLVEIAPLREDERYDALTLLQDLEDINALGTVAKQTDLQAHECRFVWNGARYQCASCSRQRNDPPPSGGPWPPSTRLGSWP